MELKKSPNAALGSKRIYFLQIGLIITLLLVIGFLSWSADERKITVLTDNPIYTNNNDLTTVTIVEPPRQAVPTNIKAFVNTDLIDVAANHTPLESPTIDYPDFPTFGEPGNTTNYSPGTPNGEPEVDEQTPLVFAEEMPTFDGKYGQTEFSRWCQSNMRYPPLAADNGIQGRVIVSFIVEPNGKLSNIKIVRGVDKILDQAALDIVTKSPDKWKPARNNGRPVRLMMQMPIVFKIE